MPKGSRVHRCVDKLKKSGKSKSVNPYAVCQISTGQKFATGKPMSYKSHLPKGASQSPKGDLGEQSDKEMRAAFPRPIKGAGPDIKTHTWLPLKEREKMAIDGKYGPADQVM